MTAAAVPTIVLNDGATLPAIGFGTYKLNGSSGMASMAGAIRAGYRLLDSAFKYENEGALGEAIRQAGVPREALRIASKLPGQRHRFAEVVPTVEESLYRARLDHYDLYLIHWPNPGRDLYVEAWQGLIEARRRGLVRSIGVCNFLPAHLERIIRETGVTPAVNQIQLHPYFPQAELRLWNEAHGIVTQSWSPLARAGQLLRDEAIGAIAERACRTIPQVILRWHLQLGALPLPKATSEARQIENLAVFDFELSAEDMEAISARARPDGRAVDLDPARYDEP